MNTVSAITARQSWYSHFIIGVIIVACWYQLVSPLLTFNTVTVSGYTYFTTSPIGVEYSRVTAQFYVWDRMKECGMCALWAHNLGGFPVFNDYYSSFMHPLSFVLSMLYGGFRGATLTLAVSFLLIGLSMWWIMILLGQSRIVQIWAPLVAMYGGHMTGRLELGTIGLPLSLASSLFVIAATIAFVQRPSIRRSVIVGFSLAALLLAGQVYMQLGTAISIPILVWLIHNEDTLTAFVTKFHTYLLIVVGICVCLAAPFIITFLMEYGSTYKRNVDFELTASQPLGFLVLNMFIDSVDFYRMDILQKGAFPFAFSTFIGYPVLIFTLIGLYVEHDNVRRKTLIAFLVICAVNFILAAAIPQKILIQILPESLSIYLASMRLIVLLNGLAVVALIVASSYGLHAIWAFVKRIVIKQRIFNPEIMPYMTQIGLILVLVWHIGTLRTFAQNWIVVQDIPQEAFSTAADLRNLQPGYVQLFNSIYETPLLQQHTKLYDLVATWSWADQAPLPPQQYFILNKNEIADPENTKLISEYNDWRLLESTDVNNAYASVTDQDGNIIPCQAESMGGLITVHCTTDQAGVLRVYEYNRGHWHATVNNNNQIVTGTDWIQTTLPSGKSTTIFTYFPWYAILYGLLLVIGILSCIILMVRPQLLENTKLSFKYHTSVDSEPV